MDHNGLFLYIDLGCLGSYHILKHLGIYQECHENFTHVDDYFEYLLGDLGTWEWKYLLCNRLGSKSYLQMWIMVWFMLTTKCMLCLKYKWNGYYWAQEEVKKLMKIFDSTKGKFTRLFGIVAILINYIHHKL